MDGKRFDELTRAAGATRRGALRALAAALLATLGGTFFAGEGADAAAAGQRGEKGGKRGDRCRPKPRQQLCRGRCGRVGDGCGGFVQCGRCGAGETCRGGRCVKIGCAPKTCAELGVACGTANDGCGGTLECGDCPACHGCRNGTCRPQPDGTACGACRECRGGACAPVPDGTICGERVEGDYRGTLRCCKGVCPNPTCLIPGTPCRAAGVCDQCCNTENAGRDILGSCEVCPAPGPGPFVCVVPCRGGRCLPCFGDTYCGKGSADTIDPGCSSDADCILGICQCGACCVAPGEPASEGKCSTCCSDRCDPEHPTLCA